MTTPKSKPAPLPTTPPDLSGRVWAAWAFKTEDEARRAAAFLTETPDGVEFVISTGTQDKATEGGNYDEQGEGWNTEEAGARVDVWRQAEGGAWRVCWSCLAEPALSDTLEAAEEDAGEECQLWLSPFDLGDAMDQAGLASLGPIDPTTTEQTGEAYDFGQPDRARPYVGPTRCARCEASGELNGSGLCGSCDEDAQKLQARSPLAVLRELLESLEEHPKGQSEALDTARRYLYGEE